MRAFEFSRCGLSISLAAALLAACGGSSIPIRATDSASSDATPLTHSKTFDYTGAKQTFIVPAGVRRLTVSAHGGVGGGGFSFRGYDSPGFPGRVYAVIRVHSGEKLYVFVGGGNGDDFNGGGPGGTEGDGKGAAGAGGGASDVRAHGDKIKDRIIVAAGGGGGGSSAIYGEDGGGNGGGLVGMSGGTDCKDTGGGSGGTQSQGGSGGAGGLGTRGGNGQPGANGALGLGGSGGNGGASDSYSGNQGGGGGGGGGGYYGGGGGGGGGAGTYYHCVDGGGGGGGSSYVEPDAITSRMWTGWRATGDGLVVFSWK